MYPFLESDEVEDSFFFFDLIVDMPIVQFCKHLTKTYVFPPSSWTLKSDVITNNVCEIK